MEPITYLPASLHATPLQSYATLRAVGTVAVDPANQGSAADFDTDVTVAGLKVGDQVFINPPADLEAALSFVGASVPAANTLRVRLRASGVINGASKSWSFIWFATS